MSWFKLASHDLRCGLLRKRYLFVALLFLLPCLMLHVGLFYDQLTGSWMDYMLYIFKGKEPPRPDQQVELPMVWLMVMSGGLLLNLDYLLSDLTSAGQQVIVRGHTRMGWFLSKCLWNLCSTCLYICGALTITALFTLITGGRFSLESSPELSLTLFGDVTFDTVTLTAGQSLCLAVVLPTLTLGALSMVEMTLCLFVKPVVSFLVCAAVLVAAVYMDAPWMPGNGAMVQRSAVIAPGGVEPWQAIVVAAAVIAGASLIGILCFRNANILGMEE